MKENSNGSHEDHHHRRPHPAVPLLAGGPRRQHRPGLRPKGPLNPETGQVIYLGDIAAQTRQTLNLVKAILAEGGASIGDVVMFRVFLTDRANFAAMNAAYEEFMAEENRRRRLPARTTLMVGLPLEGMLVEIDALAVVED